MQVSFLYENMRIEEISTSVFSGKLQIIPFSRFTELICTKKVGCKKWLRTISLHQSFRMWATLPILFKTQQQQIAQPYCDQLLVLQLLFGFRFCLQPKHVSYESCYCNHILKWSNALHQCAPSEISKVIYQTVQENDKLQCQ